MITSTLLGRLQTKTITYPVLGLVTLGFAWVGGEAYVLLFTIALIVGLVLETFWGLVVWYQPGWYAFILGAVEFLAIALTAAYFDVPISLTSALVYYVVSWVIIQLFLTYLVPVLRMCWAEYGGELW